MEVWKDIKSYEGFYQVSNGGRVRSMDRVVTNSRYGDMIVKGRIRKPSNVRGYLQYSLSKDGKRKCFYAHQLIAIAFLDNPEMHTEINHKNGIKDDNRLENLEWCSRAENVQHSFNNGLQSAVKGEKHYASKLTDQQRRLIYQLNMCGITQRHLAKEFGVKQATIQRHVKNQSYAII